MSKKVAMLYMCSVRIAPGSLANRKLGIAESSYSPNPLRAGLHEVPALPVNHREARLILR